MSERSLLIVFTLHILETSDIHGYIYPIQYANNSKSNIGLAKVSSLVQSFKKNNPNVLVIDNGDSIQGSPLQYYHATFNNNFINPVAISMNKIGYDAVTIGNHDYNYGKNYLDNYTALLDCPVVCCNVYSNNQSVYAPYLIKQYPNGPKVGLIGAVTQYIPNWENPENIKDLSFLNAFQAIKKTVNAIKEDVDLIVVTYHGGFEKDLETGEETELQTGENLGYKIATEIDEIDVLLTGHQHRSIVHNDIHNKIVIQPTHQGIEVGHATIVMNYINNQWVIVSKDAELINTAPYPADNSILKMCAPLEKTLQKWLDTPIGKATKPMLIHDPFNARLIKHDLVQFINEVQLAASGADISCNALGNSVSGFNQSITMRDIISTYIYPNTLVVKEITGKALKEVLKFNARYWTLKDEKIAVNPSFVYPKPQHYNYDMYDGIEYTLLVGENESLVTDIKKNGILIKDDDVLSIVTNNYRASGGGDFPVFKTLKTIKEIQTDMIELIANYIKDYDIIHIENHHNVTIKPLHKNKTE